MLFKIALLMTTFLFGQKVACVGNSITANGYPEIVDFWMKAEGYEWGVYNYGVPGITVSISGFDYINTQAYQEVMAKKLEHIVVMLGANDREIVYNHGTADWESDYRLLINNFRSVSQRVFLGTITYQINSNQNSATDAMNNVVKKIANAYGLRIIDFNSALGVDPDNFLADGVHPTTKGKYKLARIAFDILKTYPTDSSQVFKDMILTATYNETQQGIDLDWTDVPQTKHYRINKAWNESGTQQLWWLDFYDDEHTYQDTAIVANKTYFYMIEAFEYDTHKSPTIMITTPIYLGIDDEYWEAVKDYEEQRKIGWFGCSFKER